MCFSERVSWVTFGVSMAGVAAVTARTADPHARALAWSLALAGSMQAFEGLLWKSPGDRGVATGAMLVNHVQPLAFLAISAAMLPPASSEKAARARGLAAAYAAVMGAYTASELSDPAPLVERTASGLVWRWNYGSMAPVAYTLYLLSVLATLEAYYENPRPLQAIFCATFAGSAVLYADTSMIGSMWCFHAALLPWLLLSTT